jgi:hypothetical protein
VTATAAPALPPEFRRAVAGLSQAPVRSGVQLGTLPAPGRLAPFSHAVSATVLGPDGESEVATGRLILLHDPDGVAAWDGTLRVVIFATCEMENEMTGDPLLPEVAWTWLIDGLTQTRARYTALGGTVTATTSTRFGDISGPGRSDDLEIRASWTATTADTAEHLQAFVELLATAAGLPPEGVTSLRRMPAGR